MLNVTLPSILGLVVIAAGCAGPQEPVATGLDRPTVATSRYSKTVITPHLEAWLDPNMNVLWCSTFQLAWNEMCAQASGPLQIENAPPMVGILNKRTATKDDIDEPSYLAMAGIGPKAIEDIKNELARKFAGQPIRPVLPPAEIIPQDGWIAFAYLMKDMPFEEPFGRCPRPLVFVDNNVTWFVLGVPPPEFVGSLDEKEEKLLKYRQREAKVAEQVAIYDYKSEDDFIVELKTKSKGDRLLLAKVAPRVTLGETVDLVRRRVEASKPVKMDIKLDELAVPMVDFDITRQYGELIGKNVGQAAMPIVEAMQVIHFQLTEKGVKIISAASLESWGEPPHKMLFDKPFLILLQRQGARNPYFALWVANSELLVPMKPVPQAAPKSVEAGGVFD